MVTSLVIIIRSLLDSPAGDHNLLSCIIVSLSTQSVVVMLWSVAQLRSGHTNEVPLYSKLACRPQYN